MIDYAIKKIEELDKKIEKYYQLLLIKDELDLILKGCYILEDELKEIIEGTYTL